MATGISQIKLKIGDQWKKAKIEDFERKLGWLDEKIQKGIEGNNTIGQSLD